MLPSFYFLSFLLTSGGFFVPYGQCMKYLLLTDLIFVQLYCFFSALIGLENEDEDESEMEPVNQLRL